MTKKFINPREDWNILAILGFIALILAAGLTYFFESSNNTDNEDSQITQKEDVATGDKTDQIAEANLPKPDKSKIDLPPSEYRAKTENEDNSCLSNSGFKTPCLERTQWKSICDAAVGAYTNAFSSKVDSQMYGASYDERIAFLEGANVEISFKWDENLASNKACRYNFIVSGIWKGTNIRVEESGKLYMAQVEDDGSVYGKILMSYD